MDVTNAVDWRGLDVAVAPARPWVSRFLLVSVFANALRGEMRPKAPGTTCA